MTHIKEIQKEYKGETGDLWQASFQHIYLLGDFMPGAKGRHNCLRSGYWCFQNFKEHPQDIVKFIKRKI